MIDIDNPDIAVVFPLLEIFLIVIDDVLIGCDRNEESEKDNSTGVVVYHYDKSQIL